MSENRLSRIEGLLEQQFPEYIQYLPYPDYVRKIITLTNAGDTQKVLTLLRKTEKILIILAGNLTRDEIEWYQEITNELRNAFQATHQASD